jgi:hypothetical protein
MGGTWATRGTNLFGTNPDLAVSANGGRTPYNGEDKSENLSKMHLGRG